MNPDFARAGYNRMRSVDQDRSNRYSRHRRNLSEIDKTKVTLFGHNPEAEARFIHETVFEERIFKHFAAV